MSLYDDLLPEHLRPPSPPKECLIIGCDEPQHRDGLCRGHNRNVNEVSVLDGLEVPK